MSISSLLVIGAAKLNTCSPLPPRVSEASKASRSALVRLALASLATIGLGVSVFGAGEAEAATAVSREIYLTLDVSTSVDAAEFLQQKNGYIAAFNNASIRASILGQPLGVAVALGTFGNSAQTFVPFTLLQTDAQITSFVNLITTNLIRPGGVQSTCISCGITEAAAQIANNIYTSAKPVIDVSGDGQQNTDGCTGQTNNNVCAALTTARTNASNAGYIINGIPIGPGFNEPPGNNNQGLIPYYNAQVRTADGFIVPAANFGSFETAISTKLGFEIIGVPGPLPVMGLASAFAFSRRLRQRIKQSSSVNKDLS